MEGGEKTEIEGRPLQQGMPSWEEIAGTRAITKKYIPKGAKAMWAQCLVSALNQIATHGDGRAWREQRGRRSIGEK
jgi:hypothetical protein